MPGDAGSAIIKIKTSIDWGDLSSLESKIDALEKITHTIKVKVEAAEGQKGLDKYLKDIDKLGQDAFRKTSGGAKNASKDIQNVGSGAKDVADNFKRAGKSANVLSASSERIRKDSDDYVVALKTANKTIDGMKKNISKMQDARLGDAKSRKEFENYNKQLEEMVALRDKLGDPHGNQTNNSFNRHFNTITDSANRSLQEIKKNGEYTNEVTNQIIKGHEAATKAAEKRAKSEAKIESDRVRNLQKQEEAERKAYEQKGIREVEEQARQEKERKKLQQEVLNDIAKGEQQETQRQLKEAEKIAKASAFLKDTPEDDYKAQQRILSRRAQIDKEIANWTAAAKDSRTSQSYQDLKRFSDELGALEFKRKSGALTNGEYAEEIQRISSAALEAESNIEHFHKNTLSFGDKFKNAFSEISRYITPAMVLREGVQAVRQMVQASMDIESAMTRIQIVTGSTDTQMSHFFETASSQAQELGKGITDVAGSIETFSRLGYDLDEATNLSKFANIMANVGDVSVDEATTGITSIIKGFELKASDAEHVSDVLVEVGQKYAISASELMQAFERGGASLHASGASFEESAALFAATNAALQNAAKTGTMWNTVAARMRSSKTELAEMGESYEDLAGGFSKYRDEVLQLSGVDIMRSSGEFKNPYEIMTELAQAWDNVNGEPAKARLAEIFAGTRQLSGFMSTIINIKDAMKAYSDAMDAAGVSTEANNLYMETTAAHVEQLKAAFQELSYDTFNGDLMKGVVDFGKGSLNVIDGIIDHIGVLGTTLTTLAAGKIMKSFMKNMKESTNDLEWSLGETFHNKGNLAMLGISAGITAAIAIYEQYQKVQEAQRQKAESGAQAFEKQSAAIDDYASRITELRTKLDEGSLSESDAYSAKKELLDIQNQLNESYSKGAENLDLFNGSMEKNVQQVRDLLKQNAETFLTENGLGVKGSGLSDAINAMENMIGARSISSNQAAFLGEFNQWTEEGKVIREVAKDYEDLFEIQEINYGQSGLYFKGTAQDVQRLTDFMTDLRNAEEGLTTTDTIDYIREMGDTFIGIANERIGKYQEIYDQYKQAKIITDDDPLKLDRSREAQTAAEWMNEYAEAVTDVNEAFLSGNKEELASALDKYSSLNPIIQEAIAPGGALEQYASIFADIGNQIVQAALQQDKFTEAFTGKDASAVNKRLQTYGNDVKELGLTTSSFLNAYQDVLDGVGFAAGSPQAKIKALVDAMVDAELVSDASSSSIEEVISQLVTLGIVSEDTAQQIDDASSAIESFSEYQSTLSSAINSSRSATGLSTEEIEKLTAAYEDLESFDPEKLFENTLNGVHLNNEELKRLNAEIEQSKLTDLAKQLAAQYDQYKDLRSQGADTSAIEAEIAATQQLMAQYEGLASAYNAWINAKSGSKERDTYEGIGSGFSEMEKIKNAGWYGDPALNAWLDLVLNPSARTGDAEADWARLGQTIADTGHSILDYWQYDANGNLVSDGLFMFLDDVNHVFGDAYSTVRDGYNVWDFTGNKLQEVSDMFGLSTEAIQSFERALVDTGGAVIFDNSNLDIMTGSLKNLNKKTGILDSAGISLDFDISEMSAGELQAKIDELDGLTAEIDVEADGGEDALAMMEALQYLLDQEYYLKLNTETGGGLDSAAQKIERVNQLIAEANSQGINVHTFVEGSTEVQQIAADIAALPTDVQIAIGVTEENLNDPAGIASQFADNSINIPVNYTVHADPEAEYADQNPQVTYGIDAPAAPTYPNQNPSVNYKVNAAPAPYYPNLQRSVTYSVHTVGGGRLTKASGTMTSVARADGSMVNAPWNWKHAYADGKVALDQDELALVNELGTESIIRDGQWMLLPGGMHQEALRKGDIILSAAQTKALIQTGKASGHGHAYANGSILSNAYTLGSTAQRRTNGGSTTSLGGKSSSGSSGSKSKSSGGNNNGNKESNSEDDEPEIFDWIELAIDRIERAIKQLGITAKSTFKTLTTRLEASATEIKTVTDEIELQQKAYDRYIQQANSVGLSEDLAQRVRDGAIDINEYDKETQELIDDYQKWYEKALDCSDAIQQLHEDLGQLYEDRFNDTKDDFDAQLALLEHLTTTYENGMDNIEARGYLMTTKYYEAMRDVEKQNIDLMNKELDELTEKMSQAVNSGEIKEGSQSWYEMQQSINDVKEAIQEAETSVIDLGNSIREVLWDRFDYLQDRITEITDESQFLIDLMEHSDLFTEEGQLTNTGMATMGLHGQNYNILMNQADRYAAEIKKLNKDIANDPNNTKLLEQRQEWLEAQRESILNAEDEKDAIVDLVEEGIQKELSYLNDLIDKYKESLDTAKSLYDYQKKVNEQATAITRIQKQLTAYSGDNSEEARSTIQKLNVDLSDAQEKLQETQYQRQISDQKEMLSNLYDQYDLILNQRLDNVDALISDMINMINDNAGSISNTISTEARDVGYTLSEAMRSIWTTDGKVSSVITLYGDNFVKFGETFNGTLTTVNDTISRIAKYTAKIAGVSDEEAKTTVKNTTATTKTNTTAKPVTPAPTPQKKAAETKKADKTDQEKYGVAIAIWNGLQGWGAGDDRKKKLEAKGFNYNEIQGIVSKIKGDILSGAWNGKYYGITYKDIPNYAYNKFKSGGLVDYTGIAQVDGTPGKPESFLNAKDTKNFMLLRDVLRDITSGKASFSGSSMNLGVFSGLSRTHLPQAQKAFGVGDVTYQINIPIDHVSDYNDLVNKMRTDNKFQNLIQSMTIGQISGQGSLSKNRYKW